MRRGWRRLLGIQKLLIKAKWACVETMEFFSRGIRVLFTFSNRINLDVPIHPVL